MDQVLWLLAIVAIAGVVYLVVRATRRKEIMATRSVVLESEGNSALSRVAAAVGTLRGVRDVEIDDESCEVRARTGVNLWTFGEDIVAEVRESGQSCEATISSVCRYFGTAFDWGKNRRSIDQIARALVSGEAPRGAIAPLSPEQWVTDAEAQGEAMP